MAYIFDTAETVEDNRPTPRHRPPRTAGVATSPVTVGGAAPAPGPDLLALLDGAARAPRPG